MVNHMDMMSLTTPYTTYRNLLCVNQPLLDETEPAAPQQLPLVGWCRTTVQRECSSR
jgi:hypothetical protein